MADFHRILYLHSLHPGASLPSHVSPHLSFSAIRFSPPLRLSCPTIFFCRSSSLSTSPSSSLPSPNDLDIVSSNECPDGSFLFKFGDPSEMEKDARGSGGSSLAEDQSLADDDKARSIDSAVDEEEGAVSSGDIVLESIIDSKESDHVVELTALHMNSIELDEHLGTGSAVEKQNTSTSMTENRTNIHEESVGIKTDDSNTLSEAGTVVDTQTISPLQEEVSATINQNDSPETTMAVDTKTSSPSEEEVSLLSQEFDDGDGVTSQVLDDTSTLPEAGIIVDTPTISPFREVVSGKISQNDSAETTMAVDTKTSSPSEEVSLPSQEFDDGDAVTSQVVFDDTSTLPEAGIIVDTSTISPFQEVVSGKISQNDSAETTMAVDTKTSSPSEEEVSLPSQEFDGGDAVTSRVFDDTSTLPEAGIIVDIPTISPFQEEVSGKINQNDSPETTMAVDTKTSSTPVKEASPPSQEFNDGDTMTSQVFDDPSTLPEAGIAVGNVTISPFQEEISGKVNQSDSPETVMAVDTKTGSLSEEEALQEFDDGDATTSKVFDDLTSSLVSGTDTDTYSRNLSQEEARAQVNDDDVMASKVSLDLEMSSEGYSTSKLDISGGTSLNDDPDSLVHDDIVVDDDVEAELLPMNVEGEAGLSSDEEVASNLPSDLLVAEVFQDPVLVDDGACLTTSSEVKTDSVIGNNNKTDCAVGAECVDTAVFREEISIPALALASGVASLTCPSQELAGAEDAYVVAEERWFIVANIVAEWSLEGMKAGLYGHELLENCRTIISDSSTREVNVREVLEQSATSVQSPGLLSVLIAHFYNGVLHVANIGDTRFIIVRNGCIHKSSSPHFHEFNFPVQIRRTDDPVEVTKEYEVNLDDGDVIVMATDGLFDNLYPKDIASIVSKSYGVKMKPKEIAELLAMRAQEVGRSTSTRSPFSDEAQAAGYAGYSGGKLDHVTVIVSFVKKQSSPQHQ